MLFFAGLPPATSGPAITGLSVAVAASAPLALEVDESYTLAVPASGVATLTAATQWGALRGLESFSQLAVWGGNVIGGYNLTNLPIAVTDAPRFPWRGVLIDSSRHFLPVPTILATLDAMSYNKLNRLHWHIVDDNSWPLQSLRYPNFTRGAYEPAAIYTHQDVREIADYAWERGISITPEFDLPAHADAWGLGYPDLIISCPAPGQPLADPTPEGGVYDVVRGLLEEFVPLLRADFVHFGGDEVSNLDCWAQSPKVQAFMAAQGYSNVSQVRNYFESQLQGIAANMSLASAFWEEVSDQGFDLLNTTIVDIWLSDDKLLDVIKSGRRVIESFGGYLDQQTPHGPTHYFWADTLYNFWEHDPLAGADVTPEEAKRVLGLSASQWGEQVDGANIQSRMWPRACATAERMWSPAAFTDETDLLPRIEKQRCSMRRRGIGAGPVRQADEVGYCALPLTSPFAYKQVDWSTAASRATMSVPAA
jgi:hexosaminidase